ncbi:glycogen biosynthesis protein GlgD [Bacillus sp. 165]|nr:glycogen biosynthesis protein GlgD [Bacillus sp. 165]MBO9130902.1 glycogen biosynthesis protein GlgD [Bacillus sp. 165]
MAKRSKQNNPEQKTNNGYNQEFSNELDPVVQSKKNYAKKGQPQKAQQPY